MTVLKYPLTSCVHKAEKGRKTNAKFDPHVWLNICAGVAVFSIESIGQEAVGPRKAKQRYMGGFENLGIF